MILWRAIYCNVRLSVYTVKKAWSRWLRHHWRLHQFITHFQKFVLGLYYSISCGLFVKTLRKHYAHWLEWYVSEGGVSCFGLVALFWSSQVDDTGLALLFFYLIIFIPLTSLENMPWKEKPVRWFVWALCWGYYGERNNQIIRNVPLAWWFCLFAQLQGQNKNIVDCSTFLLYEVLVYGVKVLLAPAQRFIFSQHSEFLLSFFVHKQRLAGNWLKGHIFQPRPHTEIIFMVSFFLLFFLPVIWIGGMLLETREYKGSYFIQLSPQNHLSHSFVFLSLSLFHS